MSPNPVSFMEHLKCGQYHPRSDKHSNALASAITQDLFDFCPEVRRRADEGELVYDINFTLRAGTADWDVDLVLGAPQLGAAVPASGNSIPRQSPSVVQVAVEIKSVMTEHHKAVKNRKRDLEAHHEHVHNYSDATIAGGVLVVNAAPTFKSPLRADITVHREPKKLVEHCIAQLRSVAARGGSTGYGLEARCAIVVSVDNVDCAKSAYVTTPPAPSAGDPLHYDSFIRTICDHFTRRFRA